MKKYIIGIKDDQLTMGLATLVGKKTKIKDEVQVRKDNMGRLIDTCSLSVSEDLKEQLNQFLIKTNHSSKKVDVVIGLESIISRTIEISFLRKKELKTYIENNITTFFTVNMDEYFYDYKILQMQKKTKDEKKKIKIMLVVIPSPIIKGIKHLVESVGLTLTSTRIYPDIMMNVATKKQNIGILDIGPKKSLITIYENGSTFLYTAVNTQIDLNDENPYVDFVDEVEYFTDFYASRHQGEKLDALYTFGEYHNEEKFSTYIKDRLAIPLEQMDYKANKKYASRLDIDAHPQMVISQIRNKEIFGEEIDFINEKRLLNKKEKEFLPIHLFMILTSITILWASGYWYYLGQQELLYTKTIPESFEFMSIQSDIDERQKQLDVLESKKMAVETIQTGVFDYNETLAIIQKAVPQGVTIKSLRMTKELVDIEFNVDLKTMLAVELIVSINQLNYFEELNIAELELDDTVEHMTLQLVIKNNDFEKVGE